VLPVYYYVTRIAVRFFFAGQTTNTVRDLYECLVFWTCHNCCIL